LPRRFHVLKVGAFGSQQLPHPVNLPRRRVLALRFRLARVEYFGNQFIVWPGLLALRFALGFHYWPRLVHFALLLQKHLRLFGAPQ